VVVVNADDYSAINLWPPYHICSKLGYRSLYLYAFLKSPALRTDFIAKGFARKVERGLEGE
jgi:hypothetical protein